jgi:hypothetical protein
VGRRMKLAARQILRAATSTADALANSTRPQCSDGRGITNEVSNYELMDRITPVFQRSSQNTQVQPASSKSADQRLSVIFIPVVVGDRCRTDGDLTAFEPEDIAEEAGWGRRSPTNLLMPYRLQLPEVPMERTVKDSWSARRRGSYLFMTGMITPANLSSKRNRDRDRKKSRASFKVVPVNPIAICKDVRVTSVGYPA